jgi:hypothetical protein
MIYFHFIKSLVTYYMNHKQEEVSDLWSERFMVTLKREKQNKNPKSKEEVRRSVKSSVKYIFIQKCDNNFPQKWRITFHAKITIEMSEQNLIKKFNKNF